MWFAFGMAALLLVLGLLVHAFKLHFLISGYNTMSRAKREKVDVRRVARAIGVWSYANAAVFTVVGLLLALEIAVPIEVPLVFFGITTLVLLVRAQRYDGNIFDEDGNLRPGAGRQLALAGGVIGALVIGIIALLFLSSRPVEITATEEGVEISGLYGTTLEWESITEARLLEALPTIEMRTNGVVSYATTVLTPGGKFGSSSFSFALTRLAVSSALAPVASCTARPAAGLPL